MNTNRYIRWLLLGGLLAGTAGCASYPVSEKLRKEAKPLTLTQVLGNASAYQGDVVIWGGRVMKTVNTTNGSEIYFLEVALDSYERPLLYQFSTGRFIARSPGFLDPEIYQRGQVVTLAGRIAGQQTEAVDKIQYPYPVLTIEEIHLWRLAGRPYLYAPSWSWGYPYWAYPYWGYPHGPYPYWDYPFWP